MLLVQHNVIVQMYDVIWSSFKKNEKTIVTQLVKFGPFKIYNKCTSSSHRFQLEIEILSTFQEIRHWKLGCHAINHWVIFHSLFYMFLVSNKQLVLTACSSHPFAVHKLSAGHLRTSSATRHRKIPVFLCGGCKSHLNSFIKYFWHPIYII